MAKKKKMPANSIASTRKQKQEIDVIDYLDNPQKRGRPIIPINAAQVYELAKLQCSANEIAAFFKIHRNTVYNRFKDEIEAGYLAGNISLRRSMFRDAQKGCATIQIWLSKNILGYRDRPADEAPQIQFNVQINEVPK